MSGALPACAAVRNFAAASSPPACLLTVTLMFGLAWFQTPAILSMLGAQVQNESSTGPVGSCVSVPLEHAASALTRSAARSVEKRLVRILPPSMEFSVHVHSAEQSSLPLGNRQDFRMITVSDTVHVHIDVLGGVVR